MNYTTFKNYLELARAELGNEPSSGLNNFMGSRIHTMIEIVKAVELLQGRSELPDIIEGMKVARNRNCEYCRRERPLLLSGVHDLGAGLSTPCHALKISQLISLLEAFLN